MSADKSLTYKDAGVDIDAGNALVERIKPLAGTTMRPGVLGSIGGFGGLFELDLDKYRRPVLVSGTDGVGTKLKLAIEVGRYDTVGIDLVAMCVNDIIVQGAEPLFFLDYYASATLDVEVAVAVVSGIAQGCRQAGAALLGGETAEMPGMYASGDFDLAGFTVGVVDRDKLIDGSKVRKGDRLLGLASSGPHANGFSLIRRILQKLPDGSATEWEGTSIGTHLLEPTRIYVKSVLTLLDDCEVNAMAHITGGGLLENVNRVLPADLDAVIDGASWDRPALFSFLQEHGRIADREMLRTFNCGIGMVIIVRPEDAAGATRILAATGETVFAIGTVEDGTGQVRVE
ncbi:MAG: phosphoribosylformylglycinamidine cyclo-ligase [Gammaproteobacteria bacterium]|nr:MAG: phosphoribosylformylglycinamidine cyclo-ligase [Gammaproteobacteria bacterium]